MNNFRYCCIIFGILIIGNASARLVMQKQAYYSLKYSDTAKPLVIKYDTVNFLNKKIALFPKEYAFCEDGNWYLYNPFTREIFQYFRNNYVKTLKKYPADVEIEFFMNQNKLYAINTKGSLVDEYFNGSFLNSKKLLEGGKPLDYVLTIRQADGEIYLSTVKSSKENKYYAFDHEFDFIKEIDQQDYLKKVYSANQIEQQRYFVVMGKDTVYIKTPDGTELTDGIPIKCGRYLFYRINRFVNKTHCFAVIDTLKKAVLPNIFKPEGPSFFLFTPDGRVYLVENKIANIEKHTEGDRLTITEYLLKEE